MVRNNHSQQSRRKLDGLLRPDAPRAAGMPHADVLGYARFLADMENALVVVSDMAGGESHIFSGKFARQLDLGDYRRESSIWESRILSLMTPVEQEEKYLAELRFFHFLRHLPCSRKTDYYLVSRLRMRFADGSVHDVLHRMYYIYDDTHEHVRYAVCIYGPLTFDFSGRSHAVNSVTGLTEELTGGGSILSSRECQVLSLVDMGLKSVEIARRLNISIHTVSRHRQEIIGKLQVKNTHEACRVAKTLKII